MPCACNNRKKHNTEVPLFDFNNEFVSVTPTPAPSSGVGDTLSPWVILGIVIGCVVFVIFIIVVVFLIYRAKKLSMSINHTK